MGLQVRIPNAFTLHRVGTPQGILPFPFGVASHEAAQEVVSLLLHPLSIVDLCDFLEHFDSLVVFGVSHYEDGTTLSGIAEARDVAHRAVDTETIVIAGGDLAHLLSAFDHYNFHTFDLPARWTEDDVIERVLNYHEFKWGRTRPLLPHLPHSRFFLDSHDDCNLYLESRDDLLLKRVFERALQMYVGTVLFQASGFEGEIAPIPGELLEELWPENASLTMLREATHVEGPSVHIGISPVEFSFQETRAYPTAFFVVYDGRTGKWHISTQVETGR
jgi:hypothetical protein